MFRDRKADAQLMTNKIQNNASRRIRRVGLHLYRWSIFIAIIFLIRSQHQQSLAERKLALEVSAPIHVVQEFLPQADRFGTQRSSRGGRPILNKNGTPLGFALQTSPQSDSVIGYAGPNNTLLIFNTQETLVGLKLLESGDTDEHVELIELDEFFWKSFIGKSWQEISDSNSIDAVSGATLTSLAIREGIVYRIRGKRPSYRFTKPVTLEEVQAFFPVAASFKAYSDNPLLNQVEDEEGQLIGFFVRTSSVNDHLIGFQGPTDTVLFMDENRVIKGHDIHESYDTEIYVEDTRANWIYPRWFKGKTLEQLANLNLQEEGIDGISGATRTSMTSAESLIETAQAVIAFEEKEVEEQKAEPIKLLTADYGTAAMIVFALLMAFTKLKSVRWLRKVFQVGLVLYLGFFNGHLLSQGLFVGWAQNGIAWNFGVGLVLLAAVAFAIPLTTKTQIYCHHLCPHGALQELIKNRVGYRQKISRKIQPLLMLIIPVLLLIVLLVAMQEWAFNLASIEPFDAYLIKVAGWGTISVAVVGLIASLFVPMAYCRFGCPTGALLKFLRYHKLSDRWSRSDTFASLLLVIAISLQWL